MPEFLVHMKLNFPPGMKRPEMQRLYHKEARRAAELATAGAFLRVWRIPGQTAHISLWEARDATALHEMLESWPMFSYMDLTVTPLAVNRNDPGGAADELPEIMFTYPVLRELLDAHHAHSEEHGLDLGAGVSVHDHPGTDRGLQVHVMVDGQKVAEIGPRAAGGESVAPAYVDFLAEWEGRPVRHARWQRRIAADNELVHDSYAEAVMATRNSRLLIEGQ